MNQRQRIRLSDVARAAGVSTTTVSDALRGRGRLSQATRDHVTAVANELGYQVHPGASWLRTGRTGTIGLSFPEHTVGLEYYMRLAQGAADEAFDHGLALTLLPAGFAGAGGPGSHVDGIILSDPMVGARETTAVRDLDRPTVTVERDLTPGAGHAGRIESDHGTAVAGLLDHLAERGARRIAVLCPGEETSFGSDIRAAHEDWCRRRKHPHLVYDVPFAAGHAAVLTATRAALTASPAPDAILSVADGTVPTVLQVVLAAGFEVPRDLLLAGYVDGMTLASLSVPVTAVDLDPREVGRQAARLLADLIEGRRPPGTVVDVPVHLHERASTVSAPSAPSQPDRR